ISSLQVVKEVKATSETATDATLKPQMAVTDRFAYITSPSTGELLQVNLSSSEIKKKKVSSTPYMITILGYESSETHNH
ncbi:MAG TPA: hypothetical protein VFQ56_10130, partial [Flavobacterium sp.]|nr:hypothetical protein [Flavobacterium sp.]